MSSPILPTMPQAPQGAPAQPQPMQPPVPPPNPFPARANDSEPAVATVWMKRLSKLMFDPRFSQQPPLWQQLVNDRYTAAQQVIRAVTPLPPLPKGVDIREMVTDASGVAQGVQAALHGQAPPAQPGAPAQAAQAKQVQPATIPKMPV